MLKLKITDTDLLLFEPSLNDYLRSDELDYSNIIEACKKIITTDIKNQGKKLRNLCTPLNIATDKSAEDFIERTRVVINITSFVDGATLTLQKTNDDSAETWANVETYNITDTNEILDVIENPGRFYRIVKSGTVEYTFELVEQSFELPFTFLVLSQIYKSKQSYIDDNWTKKADDYFVLYVEKLSQTLSSYDENEDEEITANEAQTTVRTRFHR